MRQPHLRAQQAGQVDRPSEVQEVQSLPGCDLLQSRVSDRPLPCSQVDYAESTRLAEESNNSDLHHRLTAYAYMYCC